MLNEDIRKGMLISGGLLMGLGFGYIFANRQLEKTYQQIADDEIESVKARYKLLRKEPPLDTPEAAAEEFGAIGPPSDEALQDLREKLTGSRYVAEEEPKPKAPAPITSDKTPKVEYNRVSTPAPEPKHTNIFDQAEVPEDVVSNEKEDSPRIITIAEFMEDSPEHEPYDKITLTYYEADETLTDERDDVIANVDKMVSLAALTQFGELSDDESVVYVRNDALKTDFEIVKTLAGYAELVLGIRRSKGQDG